MKLKSKPKPMTEKEVSEARDRYLQLCDEENRITEEKLSIRRYLLERLYPADKEEGAETITVGNIKLSITKNLRRTIDKAEFERFRELHPKRVDEFFRLTPEVKTAAYKDNRELMDDFVVTKESPPTLSFK